MRRLTEVRPAHLGGDGPIDDAVRTAELNRAFTQSRETAHRRRRGRVLIPAVLAGAATVTAAALVAGIGGHTPAPGGPRSMPLDGRSVLLAAADEAEKLPTGNYWFTDQISGQSYIVKGGYAITGAHFETFEWTAAKAGGGHLFYGRDLPARPLTEEDEAAWRRAGAPKSFRVWSNDHYGTYTTKAGSWSADRPHETGGKFFVPGTGHELSPAELQNLPTDSATLKKTFLPTVNPMRAKVNPAAAKWFADPAHVVLQAGEAFANAPLPPKVQAALMRTVAAQPGVRSLGTVTDPLGRRAIAIGADWTDSRPAGLGKDGKPRWEKIGYIGREELLFDPHTGAYLGDQQVLVKAGTEYRTRKPGFVINYSLARSSGWTQKKPSPPASLPFK
ncbi:CU044_5270 family protein [Actinoallomurus sp. NPDC052274]|uniref:CU044_5270 family protein n=1 Tax=Actinoallomurus sp. NPDC052274 TaxID=3155420 RepID=UPI003421AD23